MGQVAATPEGHLSVSGSVSGEVHDDFDDVRAAFRKQLARTTGGAAVSIYHRGVKVVDLWGGTKEETADAERVPWQRDTLAMCFSTTKGVVSTAVHVLVDRGLIDVDAPVADYWPEFAQARKERLTVAHVLTHSAGLHRIRSLVPDASAMLDWERMTDALAAATPAYRPGSRHGPGWVAIGDAAGLVNPMNGEGIDYGLESGMLVARLFCEDPATVPVRYDRIIGERFDAFLRTGRRFSFLIGHPLLLRTGLRFAVGTRGIANVTLQVMGNLVDSSTPGVGGVTMRAADRLLALADPVLRATRAAA
jgi:hypothetical protein